MKSTAQQHRPDFILLGSVIVLVLFGLLMVYNASPVTSLRDFDDPLRLIKLQSIWVFIGLIIGTIVYKIPYTFWRKISPFLFVLALVLLLTVFIPGAGVKTYGAQRWLSFGFISVQPAEFAKLSFVLYLAALLSKKIKLSYFLLSTIAIVAIVVAQKDLGTSIIIALIGLSIYFVSGAALSHFLILIPVVVSVVAVLILSTEYRKARFLAFLNPTVDPEGISYHLHQSLIAIGSGGIFGVGLGQSRQKYGFIPEVTTDSIFAVVGNELGFIGAVVLIGVFSVLIFRGIQISKRAPDRFSQLVAAGLTSWLGFQTFVNISGLVALLPLAGVPLPFISYGGSSLIASLIAVALLLNISRYTKNKLSGS